MTLQFFPKAVYLPTKSTLLCEALCLSGRLRSATGRFWVSSVNQFLIVVSVGSNSSARPEDALPFRASSTIWSLSFCGYDGRVLGVVDIGWFLK